MPPEADQATEMSEQNGRPEQAAANDYDAFAEAYARENETSLINAYYTLPAVLGLAGDVAGRRVLDVGCGSGPLLAALRDRGAAVAGVEPSAKMLELARERLGADPDVPLHRAGLGGGPLPFADDSFDDVVACLVLHYLEDWRGPLAELRRVLAPGGRLIVVVNHPFVYKLMYPDGNYFEPHPFSEEYEFDGEKATLTFWHRSLDEMSRDFSEGGFRIAVMSEPRFAPEAHGVFPDLAEKFPGDRFICFLFLVLEAV